MKTVEKPTYISLFSSAGIGCYGFKLEGFDCVATNELITRRLEVQKFNKKCKYESGYICGDITKDATKNALYDQIALWKKREGLSRIDDRHVPVVLHDDHEEGEQCCHSSHDVLSLHIRRGDVDHHLHAELLLHEQSERRADRRKHEN